MVDEKHTKRPAPAMALRVHPDQILPQPQSSDGEPVAETAAPEEEQEEKAIGVVSSGHSIHLNVGKIARGFDPMTGRTIYRQDFRTAGPGEVVEMPKSTIARLMAAGFLVDPDRIDTTTH